MTLRLEDIIDRQDATTRLARFPDGLRTTVESPSDEQHSVGTMTKSAARHGYHHLEQIKPALEKRIIP